MNPVNITGIVAAISLLIPAIIILTCKLFNHKSLLALLIYYLFTSISNLLAQGLFPISESVLQTIGIINNYVDVPLMLTALLLFCTTPQKQRIIWRTLILFFVYEISIFIAYRLTATSSTYIMGPGILIIFIYAALFFSQYVRLSIEKSKGYGKTFMITSVLFSYGCFIFIYYFFYIQKTSAVADVYIMYYVAYFISAVLMSVGLLLMDHRTRKIKEVQIARKELAHFFQH